MRCPVDTVANHSLLADLVEQCDATFQRAAVVGVKLIVNSPVRTIATNFTGTAVVLQCTGTIIGAMEQSALVRLDDAAGMSVQQQLLSPVALLAVALIDQGCRHAGRSVHQAAGDTQPGGQGPYWGTQRAVSGKSHTEGERAYPSGGARP
ncbi:MAG: hypothetical protein NZ578_03705 [Candidatus Binatia bacterium]|nr:hypothetical protein [Candidatus Binatia bacterium]